jgi:hypothetical protein
MVDLAQDSEYENTAEFLINKYTIKAAVFTPLIRYIVKTNFDSTSITQERKNVHV